MKFKVYKLIFFFFFIIISLMLFLTTSNFIFILGSSMILILLLLSNTRTEIILNIFLLIFYQYLCFSEFIQLNYLPQAETLLGEDPIKLILAGHIWGPRYFVTYPSVILSDSFFIDIDKAFTIYSLIIMSLYIITFQKIAHEFNHKSYIYSFIVIIASLIMLEFMNGRLIFAYFGFSIILLQQIKVLKYKRFYLFPEILMTFVGLLFTTVSSGTVVVAATQILAILLVIFVNKGYLKIKHLFSLLVFLTILYLIYYDHVVIMIMKNINFFGGGFKGILSMLKHGVGRVFYKNSLLTILITTLGLSFFISLPFFLKRINSVKPKMMPIYISIIISVFGGLFGLSTATMLITPFLILACIYVNNLNSLERKSLNAKI
ncbi:hypothetical protein ACQV2R_01535 [Facklamia sp. P12937]|uniref:hypothetical protein n=1 Tax=Facklamia sp. P12937 TaxID=3421949 RepID=UPI003D16E198